MNTTGELHTMCYNKRYIQSAVGAGVGGGVGGGESHISCWEVRTVTCLLSPLGTPSQKQGRGCRHLTLVDVSLSPEVLL